MNSKSFSLFTVITQNHCCFRWKQYSPPVKADFLCDFSSLQQHPMLPSAYLKEPIPQSSAGSIFLLQPLAEITSLSSKGFHSRNTLEVQPSFRNSLLNTVYYCKPQLAILFYLPHMPFWYISAQSPDFQHICNLRPFSTAFMLQYLVPLLFRIGVL